MSYDKDQGPVMMSVPVGEGSEIDLMRALEEVIVRWFDGEAAIGSKAVRRSVNWLNSKYGGAA